MKARPLLVKGLRGGENTAKPSKPREIFRVRR